MLRVSEFSVPFNIPPLVSKSCPEIHGLSQYMYMEGAEDVVNAFIVPVSHTITPDTPIVDLDEVIRGIDDRGPAFELKLLVRSPHVERSHHPSTIHIPSDAKRYYAGYAFMRGLGVYVYGEESSAFLQ